MVRVLLGKLPYTAIYFHNEWVHHDYVMCSRNGVWQWCAYFLGWQKMFSLFLRLHDVILLWWVSYNSEIHDDVTKWKHFPRYWPFVWGIHRSPINSPHKGQWRGALIFSLICAWIHGRVNNREAGDLRRHRSHYDVTVMRFHSPWSVYPTLCEGFFVCR